MQGKMDVFRWMGLVAFVAIAAIAAMLLRTPPVGTFLQPTSDVNDQVAPDFSLPNLQGDRVQLSDFRGKPVLVNFWATWCGHCAAEMPLLEATAKKYPDQLVILALDDGEESQRVLKFRDEFGISIPILLDAGGKVADLYRAQGLPTSIFVDVDGKIQSVRIGALDPKLMETYLKTIGIQP